MNHTLVVGFDQEVSVQITLMNREEQSELDSDYFSPPDVASIFVPPWTKLPSVPFEVEDNADTP